MSKEEVNTHYNPLKGKLPIGRHNFHNPLNLSLYFETNLNYTFREARKDSRHYTGKGVATYANGDVYNGDFKDGVSEITKIFKTVFSLKVQFLLNSKFFLVPLR